ncbi:ribonuclease H-like domain-containing protein [Tanacetum coccineum]
MDVKSIFLYEKIEEEVYVCQPPGFKDPNFPDRVYKVEKVLYGLHQAPRACRRRMAYLLVKTASTPMETQKPLLKDEDGEEVDVHMYLKGQPKLGLWYLKVSPFDLVAYTDSDYARASLDRKSTTGEAEYVAASSCCGQVLWIQNELLDYSVVKTINGEVQLHALVDDKKIIISETSMRRDLKLEDEEDEAVHKELGISLVRVATTASSLEAEQNIGNITKTQSKATPNESSSLGTTSGGGPRCQETMRDTIAQTRFENVSKLSNDSLLARASPQPQKTQKPRKPKRKDTRVPQPSDPSDRVADEAVHKELGISLVRVATTASSLEAEQNIGNITKTQSKATPNESSSLGTTSGGGPRCQETMRDTIAQTRFENVSKLSNDSLLARGPHIDPPSISSSPLFRRVSGELRSTAGTPPPTHHPHFYSPDNRHHIYPHLHATIQIFTSPSSPLPKSPLPSPYTTPSSSLPQHHSRHHLDSITTISPSSPPPQPISSAPPPSWSFPPHYHLLLHLHITLSPPPSLPPLPHRTNIITTSIQPTIGPQGRLVSVVKPPSKGEFGSGNNTPKGHQQGAFGLGYNSDMGVWFWQKRNKGAFGIAEMP